MRTVREYIVPRKNSIRIQEWVRAAQSRLVGPPADMAPDDMAFATIRVAVRSYGLPDTLWNRARALGELAHDVTNYACLILSSVGLDAPIWPVRRR
jgi:hypothetical protein